MTALNVDVAVIGAGTAGLVALREIQKKTDRFVLIQDGPMGTTCARVGCMPSKVLIQTAEDFHRRAFLASKGICGGEALCVDGVGVMRHVRRLRDRFTDGMVEKTLRYGDRLIRGRARFLDVHRLEVDGRIIEANRIIIATGSRPTVPEAWKAFGDRLLTSDTLFELETLPASLAVIGMGVIGVELGQAMARLGVDVVGVARSGRIAGLSDPAVTESAIEAFSREFDLWSGYPAEVSADGNSFTVAAGPHKKNVDAVLVSIGRTPNVDTLGLERLGIALDGRGVPEYNPDTLQVGTLPIFIAGDANARDPILHEAWDDGRVAGYNAVHDQAACFKRRTPLKITFSDVNIVMAGQSFAQLKDSHIIIGQCRFGDQGRAVIRDQNVGLMRIYAVPQTGRLLGTVMFVPDGEHLGHLLAWAIQQRLTVFDVLRLPFYHPVIEEGLRTALQALAEQVGDKPHFPEMAFCDESPLSSLS